MWKTVRDIKNQSSSGFNEGKGKHNPLTLDVKVFQYPFVLNLKLVIGV